MNAIRHTITADNDKQNVQNAYKIGRAENKGIADGIGVREEGAKEVEDDDHEEGGGC